MMALTDPVLYIYSSSGLFISGQEYHVLFEVRLLFNDYSASLVDHKLTILSFHDLSFLSRDVEDTHEKHMLHFNFRHLMVQVCPGLR